VTVTPDSGGVAARLRTSSHSYALASSLLCRAIAMNDAIAARLVVGGALFVSATAVADPAAVEIFEHPNLRGTQAGYAPHDADGKPYMMRQVGAGFEHADVAVCGKYILIAGIGSYEQDALGVTPDMHAYGKNANPDDRLQTMVVAAQLTKDGLEMGGAYYVMPELSGGNRNRDIAERLSISEETVKVHVKHIMEKLGASDRTQAVTIAVRRGIIQL